MYSDEIKERIFAAADYMVENESTVRKTAKKLKVSKSTIHKDITERLTKLNPKKAADVRKVLNKNIKERHIRGGNATRLKILKLDMYNVTKYYDNLALT